MSPAFSHVDNIQCVLKHILSINGLVPRRAPSGDHCRGSSVRQARFRAFHMGELIDSSQAPFEAEIIVSVC